MSLRQLLRKPFTLPRRPISFSSTTKPPRSSFRSQYSSSESAASSESRARARINAFHSRLPKFLHPYTRGLLNAPVSHLIAFLILHEITAIVPLVGLAGLFHYMNWLPRSWVEGRWVREGVERFGRYFGRKGWFGFSRENAQSAVEGENEGAKERIETRDREKDGRVTIESTEKRWHVGEQGSRILVEVATAYAITKVFLPARILLSVWGTPWFARVFVGRVRGLIGGSKRAGPAGGVGVVEKRVDGVKKMPP
ncbi:hypothetical protein EG329_004153 [Mollisiaceae sp. DMI_Dod_QoI]|nr:hypothetical protein EG329_004153 [Helotiales sp. DMI_Dod_QoI]